MNNDKFGDIDRFLQQRKGEKKYVRCGKCGLLINIDYCEKCYPNGIGEIRMGEFARDNNGNILFNINDDDHQRRSVE